MHSLKTFRAQLLIAATAAILLPALPAQAQSADQKIQTLQESLDSLQAQVADLKRQNADKYADLSNYNLNSAKISLANGRPTFTSADGAFTAALRLLVQADTAYYGQNGNLGAVDLSSGTNFRRARLGLEGKLFTDWFYNFTSDLGGSGQEGATISQASLEYQGAAPFYARIGIFPPSAGLEDSTPASDLTFLERAQPSDLSRSIGGSDGRKALQLFDYTPNYYISAAYTGGLAGDAAVFDQQQAVVGYGAYRVYTDADSNVLLTANSSYVFKPADTTAGPALSTSPFRFRERPELNVDATRFIDTNNINADAAWNYGIEGAANYQSLYVQGGYFKFGIDRKASVQPNPVFDGFYAQASWALTGEARQYRPERGAFQAIRPLQPFSLTDGGIGAWELAGRYSVLNLDYNAGAAGTATPASGVRGGVQKIWTAAINWYPNNALRFQLDYQHSDIDHLNGAGGNIGGKVDVVSLRAQISL